MNVAGPAIPSACGLVSLGCSAAGAVARDAAGAAFRLLTLDLAAAANWMVAHVVQLIGASTSVDLGAHWFRGEEASMLRLAGLAVLPVLMAGSIGPALRQDGRRLARVWLVGLPVATLAGAAAVALTARALAITDALCGLVAGGQLPRIGARFAGTLATGMIPGAPGLVTAAISVLIVAGAAMVWLELLLRAAAVYVGVFFAPLALVGFVWPSTAAIARRAVEVVAALVLSKFVIVATLTLGAAALRAQAPADVMVAGGAILLLAAFAPFAILRLAPIVEVAAIAHLEGMSRRPIRALARTASSAAGPHPVVGLLLSARSGSEPPAPPAPVAALPIPERQADFPTGAPGDPAPPAAAGSSRRAARGSPSGETGRDG